MIEYKRNIPIKAQTGRVLYIQDRAKKAQKENDRDMAIAQQYFDQAPSIQNLARGIYHWARGSEWSPFSRSEDPDDYKHNMGTAPVPGVGKKAAVGVAKNIKDRYVKLGKYLAERQARNAKNAVNTAKNTVDNATKKVTKTARTASNKINTFWGNRMNWWETSENSTASKPTRVLFNTGRVLLGTGVVAPFAVRKAGPTIINKGLENWGIDYQLPVMNDSTEADTTNQSQIQQPTAQPQYKTLDSLRRAAIQASIELVDSINNAN